MVEMFINSTGVIAVILNSATTNITGSAFLTMLGIVIILLSLFIAFRIPIELSAIFIMPMLIVLMAFSSNFLAIGGVFLIYLGVLLAKNFFI